MKINTVREFVISESEARVLHDLIAEISLNEHRRLLTDPSLKKPLYSGSIEDAYYTLTGMYTSLHNVLDNNP
jgi:hypothetical protein